VTLEASAATTNATYYPGPTEKSSRTDLDYWNSVLQQLSHNELRNSTEFKDRVRVSETLRKIFKAASEEIFEDGMENDFSRALVSLLTTHGERALDRLAPLLTDYRVNEEIAAEAIRWLGRIDEDSSYTKRLWLLERCLYSDSVRIRDAALLGLASLDDPGALPYLRGAMAMESCDEIKLDMEDVEKQLQRTSQCP
jgi:HEAT repeat protein